MQKLITLYHGSQEIVEKPIFGNGKKNNDYGLGFYCTKNIDLAREWSLPYPSGGFVNQYTLDAECLRVLNLNSSQYTILNWITVLIEHRLFSIKAPNVRRTKQYLSDNFSVNVNAYDVITGYRADDSYYEYAAAFLNNSITVDQLSHAMKLGNLGGQIVIKSPYAFSCLHFEGYERTDERYFEKRKKRDKEANELYFKALEEEDKGLYIQDIIRGGIKNNDPRIPRNIC